MIIELPTERAGTQPSYILHERASRFEAQGTGWLSIKRFFGGAALYRTTRGAFRVDDTCYLVLGHGRSYHIEIDAREPVESFCIFIAPDAQSHILAGLAGTNAFLLDHPDARMHIDWVERTYPAALASGRLTAMLRAALAGSYAEPAWLVEQHVALIEALAGDQQLALRHAEDLGSMRPATRQELYRRLHLARDYAEAQLHEALQLSDLAAVAGLSANHLLRTYRQLFGCTPYQHLTQLRLERACRLLATTDMPIGEVGLAVGFERPSAFSWTFQRRFGMTPRAYRRQFR